MPIATLTRTEGQRIADFTSAFLTHTTGDLGGSAIQLRDWQKDILNGVFTLNENNKWQYRQALIITPRKCGKSEIGSSMCLYVLLGKPDVFGAQIFSVAGSKDQARIVFGAAKKMVEAQPEFKEYVRIYRDAIENVVTGSVYRVLSSDGKLQHGLNSYFCTVDESWVLPNGELPEALLSSSGARSESLLVHITTPGSGTDGYLKGLVNHAEAIRAGAVEDPTFYCHWNKPPVDVDHTDPAVWATYNPAYGDWISKEFLASQLVQLPEAEFKRLHLAAWTDAHEAWLPAGTWDALPTAAPLAPGDEVALGVDASLNYDDSAVIACKRDGSIYVLGHWHPTDGETIDLNDVRLVIEEACRTYNVREIACDPWYFRDVMFELDKQGYPVVEYRTNSTSLMVPACEEFYKAVMNGAISHDHNPQLGLHISHTRIKSDKLGTRITKESKNSRNKIDLAVAAVIAHDRAIQLPEPKKRTLTF